MKAIRNALMLGACTLLPAVAVAQTTPAQTTPATTPASAPAATSAAPSQGQPAATSAAPVGTTPATTSTAPAATGGAQTGTSSTAPAAGAAPGATSMASLAAGAKVLDTAGGTAGTIESVDGDFVVLATTKSKVRLPKSSFAMGPNGPVIAMTAAQLDAAAAQAAPAAAASSSAKPNVAQGAAVSDTKGGSVGTVSAVEGSTATVTLAGGGKVRLPVTAFAAGSGGGLTVAMSAAQLKAAAGAAK